MSDSRGASSEVDWDDVARRNYAASLQRFEGWFDSADELQFAADQIKPQVLLWWEGIIEWQRLKGQPRKFPTYGCHSILMMLNSFVIENLCKGAFVRDGIVRIPLSIESPKKLPPEFKDHDLRQLVTRIELALEDHEEDLLGRMKRAAVWRGRYPVAIRYDTDLHTLRLSDGRRVSAATFGQRDVSRMDEFIERLRMHVRAPRSATVARDAAP